MESEPNRYSEFLKRQRALLPPLHMGEDLERKVMTGISGSHPERRRVRTRWAAVPAVGLLMLVAGILLIHPSRQTSSTKEPSVFEESIVFCGDDLVCIWLEPLRDTNPETTQ